MLATARSRSSLASLPGIRHGFFTRQGGVSQGVYASLNCGLGSADDAGRCRREPRPRRPPPRRPPRDVATSTRCTARRASSSTARSPPDERPQADALVTAHAGPRRRRADGRLRPGAVRRPGGRRRRRRPRRLARGGRRRPRGDRRGDGAARRRARAHRRRVGPCISQVAYEVGPDFEEAFLVARSDDRFFLARDNAPGAAAFRSARATSRMRLQRAGIGQV